MGQGVKNVEISVKIKCRLPMRQSLPPKVLRYLPISIPTSTFIPLDYLTVSIVYIVTRNL